ncbi:MAG: carbohydrate porin [bacterium]
MPLAGGLLASLLTPAAGADAAGTGPVSAALTYTGEAWRNIDGGRRTGSAYLDNVDATLAVNADAAWGWRDTSIFLHAIYNNGDSLSGSLAGDAQVISNIDTGVRAARVLEAWIDAPLGSGGSIRAGLYDLNSEFDALESAQLFIHSAHGIGTDIGQSGRNGPSIFPVTGAGVRVAWTLPGAWTVRAAVVDGKPGDPDDAERTTIRLSSQEGALVVAEAAWGEPGRQLLAGAWGYTARFDTWRPSAAAPTPRRARGNGGVYLRGETPVGGADSGITVFGRLGVADGRFNVFSSFLGAGVTVDGARFGRPRDRFGAAVAWAEASSRFQTHGFADGAEPDDREVALEITYRLHLSDRIALQPDLQYVIDPGLRHGRDDVWAAALRFEVALLR